MSNAIQCHDTKKWKVMRNRKALRVTVFIVLIFEIPFALPKDVTNIVKTDDVEVNMLSDFEAGNRFFNAGDSERAIIMFKQGVEKGDPRAMYALGTHYYFGDGVETDFSSAHDLFSRSLEKAQGSWKYWSAYMLSLMYKNGNGVEPDSSKAINFVKTAAIGCVPEAQNIVSQLYYYGDGLKKNENLGIGWLSVAADHEELEVSALVQQIKANLNESDIEKVVTYEKDIRSKLDCVKK